MKATVRQYLTGLVSAGDRTKVRNKLRTLNGGTVEGMNMRLRERLHDAIFSVENDLESRGGGMPDCPRVVSLRAARNEVLDDLGLNEYPAWRAKPAMVSAGNGSVKGS